MTFQFTYTAAPSDTTRVELGATDYVLTVRDRHGDVKVRLGLSSEALAALEGQVQAARVRRLMAVDDAVRNGLGIV